VGAAAAGWLAIYIALDADKNPAFTPDEPGEITLPVVLQDNPNVPALPPESPEVGNPLTRYHIPPEPGVPSNLNPRRDPTEPKAYTLPPRTVISNEMLAPKAVEPRPVPEAVLAAMKEADKAAEEKSHKFGHQRAKGLLEKVEGALKGGESPEATQVRSSTGWIPPLVVREYAASRPSTPSSATDEDTILWQPLIVLPADGKTTLHLTLGKADAYQVIVAGHTPDGRIGSVRTVIPVAPGK
jgi:hypothetical protein